MAAAIIPIAASLLPVILPEVKSIIQLVEAAFNKVPKPPNDVVISPAPPVSPNGQAKMDTAIQLVQAVLGALQGSGLVMPARDSIQGFIEGLFQVMKHSGELSPVPTPAPASPVPVPDQTFKGLVIPLVEGTWTTKS